MATRTLSVQITGDARSLNKALNDSESKTKKWSGRITAAGIAAGTGLAVGLKKSAEAAIEAEKSQSRMVTQLNAAGISYKAHARQIDEVIQKHSQLSGLDDEDLQDSFTNLVRVTGDVNEALKLNTIAMDFARAKHIDVAKAGELVGKVAGGNTGILSRYGIQIDKGASSTEALGMLQEKFAGQAEAYGKTTAGAGDRAAVAWENLKETLGESLLPVLAKAGDALAKVLNWMQRNKGATQALIVTVGGLVTVLGAVMVATKIAAALRTLRVAVLAVNVAMRANPIGLVITALVALGVAVVTAYKKSETFRNVVKEVWRVVKNAAISAIDFILGGVQRFLEGLAKVMDAAAKLPGVGKKFRGLADDVRGAAADVGRLRENLRELKSRKIKVDVDLAFNGPKLQGSHPFAKGDGLGARINAGVAAGARRAARSMVPMGSANLMGADFDLGPFARIGAGMGLSVSSGLRPGAVTSSGNPSFHGSGDAIDMSGPPSAMGRFFRTMKGMFGNRLRELIYTPGGAGIKDGRPYTYTGEVAADHYDHVHVAYTGPFGDGIGDIRNLARRVGFPNPNLAAAVAMAESGGDPTAWGDRDLGGSYGLWQIHHPSHPQYPISKLKQREFNARAAFAISGGGRNWAPWTTFRTGAYKRFLTGGGSGGSGGSGGGSSRTPGMSAAEFAFRESQSNVSGSAGVAIRNARRNTGPAKGGGRTGPQKGRQPDDWMLPVDEGAVSDPAAEALAAALEASTRATEEHTAALRGVESEMKRQTDLAVQTIATDSFQKSKWIADVLSGQFGRGIVGRGMTAGVGVEVAY